MVALAEPEVGALRGARIAIVHTWTVHVRGGEKVFVELARAFPEADLFTLFGRQCVLPPDLRRRLQTSGLQHIPAWRVSHRAMLPLLPAAIESLNVSAYDLVISSSSGWAHGVITGDDAVHLCYMHSPPRYLWGTEPPTRAGKVLTAFARGHIRRLRMWDQLAAQRVDHFLANSTATARRINRRYRRNSDVVHPPVDLEPFVAQAEPPKGDFVIAAGELVPYKRFDLAVACAAEAGVRLLIVGEGPDRKRLVRMARDSDATFIGRVSDAELARLFSKARAFIHPGDEDFGITTVEALAAGTPVVGRAGSGSEDIVGRRPVGRLVAGDSPKLWAHALTSVLSSPPPASACRERATDFAPEVFRASVQAVAARLLAER